MRVITSPEPLKISAGEISWFLGGGITGCPDWQADMIDLLSGINGVLLNPRRPQFDIADPLVNDEQVEWENQGLTQAAGRLFWFPAESICPITLFELGAWAYQRERLLVVGADPDYPRLWDIKKQMSLVRPQVPVVSSLASLAEEVTRAGKTVSQLI